MEEEEGEDGGGSKREGRLASAVKEGQDHLVLRLLQAGVPVDGVDDEAVSQDSIAVSLFGNMIGIDEKYSCSKTDYSSHCNANTKGNFLSKGESPCKSCGSSQASNRCLASEIRGTIRAGTPGKVLESAVS